jgi:hypothetical protein
MAMKLRVPYNVEKFLSSSATGGFSTRTKLYRVTVTGLTQLTQAVASEASVV